jgi:hypothetical protein
VDGGDDDGEVEGSDDGGVDAGSDGGAEDEDTSTDEADDAQDDVDGSAREGDGSDAPAEREGRGSATSDRVHEALTLDGELRPGDEGWGAAVSESARSGGHGERVSRAARGDAPPAPEAAPGPPAEAPGRSGQAPGRAGGR